MVVNSTDQQVRQLYALANEEGEELARDYDWQVMRQQQTFTTVAQAEQTGAIPADLDRFVSNSFFNRTTVRQVVGPLTPQQYQALLTQPQLSGIYLAFIERQGAFLVNPVPPAGQVIAYEYVSVNWAKSSVGVPQPRFQADNDGSFISERLIKLGIRWRFLKAKGLDYAEDMRTYEIEKQKAKARDGANSALSSTGYDDYIIAANIPEGNFPGSGVV